MRKKLITNAIVCRPKNENLPLFRPDLFTFFWLLTDQDNIDIEFNHIFPTPKLIVARKWIQSIFSGGRPQLQTHAVTRRTHKSMCRISADEFHAIKRWRFCDGRVKRNNRLKSIRNGKHGRRRLAISVFPFSFALLWLMGQSFLTDVTISRGE